MLSSHGREIRPLDTLKKDSQDLSRVLARIPGFPRLVPVTSGREEGNSNESYQGNFQPWDYIIQLGYAYVGKDTS